MEMARAYENMMETFRSKNPDGTTVIVKEEHHAFIELAEKVIESEDRLLNTLAHKFCHLANFMKTQPLQLILATAKPGSAVGDISLARTRATVTLSGVSLDETFSVWW